MPKDTNTSISWNLSNPQYFPDDSTPPVPHANISSVENTSLVFHRGDIITPKISPNLTTTRDENISGKALSEHNFVGRVETKNFDYVTGLTDFSLDHTISSRLNVDVRTPHWSVKNKKSLETYFYSLVPALCGIHTLETPQGGEFLSHTVASSNYIEISGNADYSINRENRLLVLEDSFGGVSNKYFRNVDIEEPRTYKYIDFIYDQIPAGNVLRPKGGVFYIYTPNYIIRFSVYTDYDYVSELYNMDYNISFLDLANDPDGGYKRISARINYNNMDLRYPVIFRIDFENSLVHLNAVRIEGVPLTYQYAANNMPESPSFAIERITYSSDVGVGSRSLSQSTLQIIGYNGTTDLSEQYQSNTPNRHYFDDILQIEGNNIQLEIPPYNGNGWSHLNQLASFFPFRELI